MGYSAADVREILEDTWQYFQCAIGGDASSDTSRSDFFGLNSYSWCGDVNTFTTSGYDVLAAMFQSSSIPVIFSEYGCNEVKPRTFPEVPSLYGEKMTMLSGGLVYEYSQEEADFGLVDINDNATVTLRVDYTNLQSKYNTLDLKLLQNANSTAQSLTPPKCSSSLITEDGFSTSFNIPDTPDDAVDYINNGISNPPVGKIVQISSLTVPMAIYGVDGVELPQMSVTAVKDSNTPSGESINGTSTGSSSSSKTDSPAIALGVDAYALGAGALLGSIFGLW